MQTKIEMIRRKSSRKMSILLFPVWVRELHPDLKHWYNTGYKYLYPFGNDNLLELTIDVIANDKLNRKPAIIQNPKKVKRHNLYRANFLTLV